MNYFHCSTDCVPVERNWSFLEQGTQAATPCPLGLLKPELQHNVHMDRDYTFPQKSPAFLLVHRVISYVFLVTPVCNYAVCVKCEAHCLNTGFVAA